MTNEENQPIKLSAKDIEMLEEALEPPRKTTIDIEQMIAQTKIAVAQMNRIVFIEKDND
jgi:hypothetical protein